MAPRVDRPVVRVSPPGGARRTGPQGPDRRPISDLERTPNPFGHPVPDFLSLFKGQGASRRGDDRVVSDGIGTAPAGV